MKPRVGVFSLDWDDCLVRKDEGYDAVNESEFNEIVNGHKPPRDKIKWRARLSQDNEALLEYIASVADKYDEIIICPGTARQNPYTDLTNSCKDRRYTGSAYEGLEIFQRTLQERLKKPVSLDRTTTADFFHERKKGETFGRTTAWLNTGKEEKDFFTADPNDRTKVSLHYMYMHRMANERPGSEIDYYAVDDGYQREIKLPNPAIIDSVRDVYSKNTHLIPASTTLITVPYQQGTIADIAQVQGTGAIDLRYDNTMLEMMVCSMDTDHDSDGARRKQLFEFQGCSCWHVFSEPEKTRRFDSVLRARKTLSVPGVPSVASTDMAAERKVAEDSPLLGRAQSISKPSRWPLFFSSVTAASSATGLIGSLVASSASATVFVAICSAIPVWGWALLLAASVGGIAYSFYRERQYSRMVAAEASSHHRSPFLGMSSA